MPQRAVVPVIVQAAGAVVAMVIVLVADELLLPQAFVGVTVTCPLVLPAFTSILVVPCPLTIVQPCGTDQV